MSSAPVTPQVKPPVDPSSLTYKELLDGDFWRRIPAYEAVDETTFLDHKWQAKNTITRVDKLLAAVQGLVPPSFIADAEDGFKRAPMNVRVSPYLLSLIDWSAPYTDPLRIQFIPVGSGIRPDHPELGLDSLGEQADSPVAGLTHRYRDKALFLALDTCPVYCRFCTRSYAIGGDTDGVEKVSLKANRERWSKAFEYIESRPELEDIVVSGGDSYQLRDDMIREIGTRLLNMPNIRRIRFATKGLAVMPQKVLTDEPWFRAIVDMVNLGRRLHKQVVVHTHFNHPNELTAITARATNRLFEEGVTVRNQTVLLRGVNDDLATMRLLVKRMGHINVQPYYIYAHDLVQGVEDLRTTLQTALDLEKNLRGTTAGFNTPNLIVDAPGGGGKRVASTYEVYDRVTGVSIYTAPGVKGDQQFLYFDPVDLLPEEGRKRWADPAQHQLMIDEAKAQIGLR